MLRTVIGFIKFLKLSITIVLVYCLNMPSNFNIVKTDNNIMFPQRGTFEISRTRLEQYFSDLQELKHCIKFNEVTRKFKNLKILNKSTQRKDNDR